MDPHNDFDKHDRAPYDIAPATNMSYAAMRQERDELSERVGRYALEFEILTRRLNSRGTVAHEFDWAGSTSKWRMGSLQRP